MSLFLFYCTSKREEDDRFVQASRPSKEKTKPIRALSPPTPLQQHFREDAPMKQLGFPAMAAFCIPQTTATTNAATTFTTRFVNHTDRAIDLQIRVGSTLKKSYTVQPGCSKKLGSKHIYNTYNMPQNGAAMVMTFHRNEIFQPYIWIHDSSDYTKMVKQQYVSLEDMRNHSEIKICRSHRKGTIQVHKKARVDLF